MITVRDMRIIEDNAEELGLPKIRLMENAGRGAADAIIDYLQQKKEKAEGKKVLVFAGLGNNGGDGFVVLRHLTQFGMIGTVFLLGTKDKLRTTDARSNFRILEDMIFNVKIKEIKDSSELKKLKDEINSADIIIDAMLGTGLRGDLRDPYATAVDLINNSKKLVVAIDTPTGLNPDTGEIHGTAVKATFTVTFHDIKPGLVDRKVYTGDVIIKKIGVPPEAAIIVGKGDVREAFRPRKPESHKGDFGRLIVIGGGKYFTGAPAIAALAAYKLGTDLVTVITPEYVENTIRSYSPTLIVRGYPGEVLNKNVFKVLDEYIDTVDAVVLGPGTGRDEQIVSFLPELLQYLKDSGKPVVIDADPLRILAKNKELFPWKQAILTPHQGEFKSLLPEGTEVPKGLEEKMKLVSKTAKDLGVTIVLKGRYDIISDGDKIKINRTGNPGMTVGGTGDSLCGLIGGLLANKKDRFLAACVGAYINGLAGDLAVSELGYHLTPIDVVERIPTAIEKTLRM